MRLKLHMVLDVGDIQWLSNEHVLHSRTEYKDHAPPIPRRHLMRLWLSTPENEGGWSRKCLGMDGLLRRSYMLIVDLILQFDVDLARYILEPQIEMVAGNRMREILQS